MKIKLIAQRRDDSVVFEKRGESLLIDGEIYDFSVMPEGSTLPNSSLDQARFSVPWLIGDVSMINGEVELALSMAMPAGMPDAAYDPEDIHMLSDGVIDLPNKLPLSVSELSSSVVNGGIGE